MTAPDSPELLEALKDVIGAKGWSLVCAESDQLYTAEKTGTAPIVSVSAGSPGGLVTAIDSHAEREARSDVDFTQLGPQVMTGTIGVEQLSDVVRDDAENEAGEEEQT